MGRFIGPAAFKSFVLSLVQKERNLRHHRQRKGGSSHQISMRGVRHPRAREPPHYLRRQYRIHLHGL